MANCGGGGLKIPRLVAHFGLFTTTWANFRLAIFHFGEISSHLMENINTFGGLAGGHRVDVDVGVTSAASFHPGRSPPTRRV